MHRNTYRESILTVVLVATAFFVRAQKHPVIDTDFPDPTVILAEGKYYAFATNSTRNGVLFKVQVAESPDLKNWKMKGDAMPQKPLWASSDFWAPHVIYNNILQQYVLFFSAQTNDAAKGMGIGVAFSKSPAGPYIPEPEPLITDTGFVAIDAMVIKDPVTHKYFMTWGSGFQPIKIRQLKTTMTGFENGSTALSIIPVAEDKQYSRLVEGPWIDYDNGFYYLYYSGDNCCGEQANYAVLVARAKNITGPYTRLGEWNKTGNSVLLERGTHLIAPGHNSIIKDRAGKRWIAYHAIPAAAFRSGKYARLMYLDPVRYKDGWPIVKDGPPSTEK